MPGPGGPPLDAAAVIALLGLVPHPEGGHYRETFRDPSEADGRSVGTAIYFLLRAGEASRWHRIDAAEIWHWYAGAPIELRIAARAEDPPAASVLGPDLASGSRPQLVVPSGYWQSARSLGGWTLAGCTVAPGFRFQGFELAPPDWSPGGP